MLSNRRRALLLVACLGLAACSPPDNSPDEYGAAALEKFLDGCTGRISERQDPSPEQPVVLGSESTCTCLYDYFAENLPYEDFETLDDEVEADPTSMPAEVQLAQDRCSAGPVAPTTTEAP